MLNFNFSEKGVGLVSPRFVYDFSTDQLTKFHYLIALTSQDIELYVYYNCLLTRL